MSELTTRLVLWTNPSCSKSNATEELVAELGVPVAPRRYLSEPPSRQELEEVLRKLGTDDPRAITRTGEPAYAGLEEAGRDELLDALATHPELIERPIAILGDRAVVCRPPERLRELLDAPA
ncbi:MAG TPA: ArsC/Spx/MgsR family protein [Mycobacteriales bacterium]|nr:ArsC/Spx/MgsR family protein [Mycobacteriales bacterium]